MAIPYYLVDNPLTPDPKDFRANLQLNDTKKRQDIVNRILSKNVGLAESELLAVFEEERRAIEEFLAEGYKVDTGLLTIKPTMKGVFNSANESFTPGKHELRIKIHARNTLQEVLKRISVVKVVNSVSLPVLTIFEDMISQTNNETITKGKTAKVYGDKLKFDATDTEQGVFFVKADDTVTRVNEYIEVGNKKLIFNIPDTLTKGDYTLEVKTKTSAGEVRTGTLQEDLSVL